MGVKLLAEYAGEQALIRPGKRMCERPTALHPYPCKALDQPSARAARGLSQCQPPQHQRTRVAGLDLCLGGPSPPADDGQPLRVCFLKFFLCAFAEDEGF